MVIDYHLCLLLSNDNCEIKDPESVKTAFTIINSVLSCFITKNKLEEKTQKVLNVDLIKKLNVKYLPDFISSRLSMYQELFPNILEIYEGMTID